MPASWLFSTRSAGDDVQRRARVELDAVVELVDVAAGDGDRVVAVVEHAGVEPGAVDHVAVEVDRDVVGADDQAVARAVDQVAGEPDALGDELAADARGRHRRRSVMRHAQAAGVASTLPSASIARTWNVCVPTDSPL